MLHKKQALIITPENIYLPDGTVLSYREPADIRIFPEKGWTATALLSLIKEVPEQFPVLGARMEESRPGFLTFTLEKNIDRSIRMDILSCCILQVRPEKEKRRKKAWPTP